MLKAEKHQLMWLALSNLYPSYVHAFFHRGFNNTTNLCILLGELSPAITWSQARWAKLNVWID